MTTTEELIGIGRAAREAARRHLLARDPELAKAARADAARIAGLEAEVARLADENAALRADAARRAPRGRKPT